MPQACWRWLCDGNHGISRDDRQHLLGELRQLIYSHTREAFNEKMEEFSSGKICSKYPQYSNHLENSYADRLPAWAMYSRRERQLPTRTHGSNTNAYAEISMKATKETQFGRIKTRNLPEMLSKICDNSAMYRDKLIEVGNNWSTLRRARSKYIGPKTTLTTNQVHHLGEGCYIVFTEDTFVENRYVKYDSIVYTVKLKG